MPHFSLHTTLLDIPPLRATLHANPRAGAFAAFEGWVRQHNEGRPVHGLRYQAYVELAEHEGRQIVEEALTRFDILDARCAHRIGELGIGELAVWVGVSAEHRGPAFAACRYIIDEVKARVPIWKHEYYSDGHSDWLYPDQTPILPAGEGHG